MKVQKEVGKSSWFGFSLILKEDSKYKRSQLLERLDKAKIEYRPIVSGNFLKNQAIKFFDYEIFEDLKNAEYLDKNGFFVGNQHDNLTDQIKYLYKTLEK